MSLFPAYACQSESSDKNEKSKDDEWLKNSSFPTEIVAGDPQTEPSSSDRDDTVSKDRKRKKKAKKHSKKKRRNASPEAPRIITEEQSFVIDTTRVKEYAWVDTIARPSAPRYRVKYYLCSGQRKSKKKKFKRYYKQPPEKKKEDDESKLTRENLSKAGLGERDEYFPGFKQEEELTRKTEKYNKLLADDPNDTKTWLEYINFQDSVYEFERNYRKGSAAKAQRVLAERKIAILEKALCSNSDCDDFWRERIKISAAAFPSDELQEQLGKLVDKHKDNIVLWQGYIEATQCSMSHCSAPEVLRLYSDCLSTLHKLRRGTTAERHQLEESIMRMLYRCGLFLKQAGLFEQLWTLLRLYLELNLVAAPANFNISSGFREGQLVDLEEAVFGSQLPLHELWLRTEKLRESCHWLPYDGEAPCEDPQRMVFAEDVAELIHPITTEQNVFKLVATVLTLLKVPLLPCRHVTMRELGLDHVPWSLDSIEALLPCFYPLYTVDFYDENLLNDATARLAVGPQYLKVLPAQEEYLEFLLTIMQNCAEGLSGNDRIAGLVWWIRFQKLLIVLHKRNRFKLPQYLRKKIKTNIKNILKREEYRTNEIFFAEYALIEYELGNTETCFNVFTTAIDMNKNKEIDRQNFVPAQTNQCFLFRALVECYLKQNLRMEALEFLTRLALQRKFEKLTNGLLLEAKTKFGLVTETLKTKKLEEHSATQNFLPNFETDWILCHAYFTFLTGDLKECVEFTKNVIQSLEEENKGEFWQVEVLREFHCAMSFKQSEEKRNYKDLDGVLHESVSSFPNNIYQLVVLAKRQGSAFSMGPPWWRVQKLLLDTGRANAAIFAVAIADLFNWRCRKSFGEVSASLKYRTLALFKRITGLGSATRRCGLIWRLYLQFVHGHFDAKMCREVYYSAVEECPWLKVLYIDAAVYVPAELAQIQDLIVEKQLRLHVTPEELDVLRS